MKSYKPDLSILAGAMVLAAASAAYNAFLHAPAVIEARPEVAGLDFWTALFSGRFIAWFYHTNTALAVVMTFTIWILGAVIGIGVSRL